MVGIICATSHRYLTTLVCDAIDQQHRHRYKEEKQKNRFNPSFPHTCMNICKGVEYKKKILIADNETYGLYGKQSELSAYKTV
ncbi:hypothetical protein CEXT_507621 [Caerostris extrusa]|uniref:Uncharacterized protein n=1 Tax=Caerostris extrusa TaxID=172846 RepID=A0AAV4PA51_CAEEX|nr:hypothetical protein CEXT_507621 [Caerostris extrusa]